MTVIVVGSGAAGAVLAAQLSEDPSRHVLLLEAGNVDRDFPPELLDPTTIRGAEPSHSANWSHPAMLTPTRAYEIARGRILGGSTTTNGASFIRARQRDVDGWAQHGEQWSHDNTLDILRSLEADVDYPTSPHHGAAGPIPVRRVRSGRLPDAFTRAAVARGHALEPDMNGDQPAGVGPVPHNIAGGVRVNIALACLEPVRLRPNLSVRGGVRVLRVLFRGSRAIGVETTRGSFAADEIVLAAGAIGSAQILLASGVGPRSDLEKVGVPVVADLPVGAMFSDHPNVPVTWHPNRLGRESQVWSAFPAALHWDSTGGGDPDGDIEILLASRPMGELLTGVVHADDPLSLIVGLQTPVSRGDITLRSADPAARARIDFHYLEDATDRARLRAGVREAIALLGSAAFEEVFAGLANIEPDLDDAQLDEWILSHLGTAIHMCGTAPMGTVVDGIGRVMGVERLRVADTSILPTVPRRGPFASAVMVGALIGRSFEA